LTTIFDRDSLHGVCESVLFVTFRLVAGVQKWTTMSIIVNGAVFFKLQTRWCRKISIILNAAVFFQASN